VSATASTVEDRREAVLRRLRDDYEFYPEKALHIVNAQGVEQPFLLKRPQRRMARKLMAQRDAGEPQRAIILKARKVGFSTQTQGLVIQRATQIEHHHAQIVAQDSTTAGDIHRIGRFMWAHLPHDVRPDLQSERNGLKPYLMFGNPSSLARRAGHLGLNSRIDMASAKEVDTGRGLTLRTLHLSEVAFWPVAATRAGRGSKKLALLNAVPDDADTLVVMESTANGLNHFRDDWDNAVQGLSGFLPIFTPWFEEPSYRRAFTGPADREALEASIGDGPYGEDEPELAELIPSSYRAWREEWRDDPVAPWDGPVTDDDVWTATLEHLAWRRWAIASKTEGDVEKFHQEYPSTDDEAFLSTGRKVFAAVHVRRVLEQSREVQPELGALAGKREKVVRAPRGVTIEVPQAAAWTPGRRLEGGVRPSWRVYRHPRQKDGTPDGRAYIVACDPMSGEDNDGELANHAITVIDHRSLELVAEYESQVDPDQVALELLLAAIYWNRALVSVEVTGGWGNPIVNRLARDYRWPRMYLRQSKLTRTAHADRSAGMEHRPGDEAGHGSQGVGAPADRRGWHPEPGAGGAAAHLRSESTRAQRAGAGQAVRRPHGMDAGAARGGAHPDPRGVHPPAPLRCDGQDLRRVRTT
jgi:hypothetical protein